MLRQRLRLIPDNGAIRTRVDQVSSALCLDGIDDHNAIRALSDRVVPCGLDAGRIVTVIAHDRNVRDVYHGSLPSHRALYPDRAGALCGMRRRIPGELVSDQFIFCRKYTIIAVFAPRNVDNQIPFAHDQMASILIECSQRSTCTRQELGDMLLVPLIWGREGVRVFMHPPISMCSPAMTIFLYSALASKDFTTPGAIMGDTSATQRTAPRSLNTLTRLRSLIPRTDA